MKKSLTLLALLLSAISAFAQPSNDDCSGLVDLGIAPICPILDTFTNFNATQSVVFSNPIDNIPSCFTGGIIDRDVWFMFTVPSDGSVVDFTVEVLGVNGPNGSITQPQIAVYRGDCELDGLQELNCATAAIGETMVEIDLIGLTPGLPYFLRISDWTASASPNWGDFELCVKEYEPIYNMGEEDFSAACAGTLYDSGGPNGDYLDNENHEFTVCPQDFTQCLHVDIETFATEFNFDYLRIFIGDGTNDPQLTSISGAGGNVQLQVYGQCVTFQFTSDGFFTDAGFVLTWQCSPDTCTVPPPSTCDNPTVIATLPYSADDMTTCNAANAVDNSPCNDSDWLQGEDVIFTYTSAGDECIAVNLTGTNNATGVGIFDACPNIAAECIAQAGGGFGEVDPTINAAFLQDPGTYYIVVDNSTSCTPFNIEVTQVTCPVVLPSAADCENAITLNGCGELPAIVSVAPGQGDPSVIQGGVNDGCWGGFTANFTWFFFQAQADGDFGFVMEATNPAEASDIDFQVWGPITLLEDLCTYAYENQPIRSSYAAGADPTGLADVHPITNVPVTDVCETAAGDDFVSTIPVLAGEFYVVLVNDWGGQISSGAVSIDFGNTSFGVLDDMSAPFGITPDTAVCPGETAQLLATGGEVYQWFPPTGLSCIYCDNPVATVSQSTVYSVAINSLCQSDTLEVEVGFLSVDAGPDITVCLNEDIQIVAGASFTNVSYQWDDPLGFLSCTDCPDPIVTASQAGSFTFNVTVTGPSCAFSDSMTLTVLANGAPSYTINDDQSICQGETVNLGGPATPGVSYIWASNPVGFSSNSANPDVTPSATTTYYLTATNAVCPLPSLDSITVEVAIPPVIQIINDTSICLGQSLVMGNTVVEPGVAYSWTNSGTINDPNTANPTATPTQNTTYTLTATRLNCTVQETVNVNVVQLGIDIVNPDTIPICKGASVPLSATSFPAGVLVSWTPNDGSLSGTNGNNVTATPNTATSYVASISTGGCIRYDTIYIGVDSLPWNTEILPADTVICQGQQVLLTSTVYEPGDFNEIGFEWTGDGQLTPDSFYNMVVQPAITTTYFRLATNGFCSRLDSVTVNVINVSAITVTPALDTICGGDSIQLIVTGSPEIDSYTWTPATSLSCGDCPNPMAFPTQTTTYTVEAEFDGCPVSATATIVVPSGDLFDLNDKFICPGDDVLLNSVNNPAASYSWTSSDGSLTTNNPTPTVSPTAATTYTVVATLGNCVSTDQLTVTIATNFTLNIEQPSIFCPNSTDSVSLTVTASPASPTYEYAWVNENGGIIGGGSTINVLPNTTTTYGVTVQDTMNCFNNSLEVIVEVAPPFSVSAGPDTTVQAGSPVSLEGTATLPAINLTWYQGNEVIANQASVTVNTCENTVYTLVGVDAFGCSATDEVEVFVNQGYAINNLYAVEAEANDSTIYEGETFVLVVSTTPAILPNSTYNWYVNDSLVSTTNDTVSAMLNAIEIFGEDFSDSIPINISVQIISETGCEASDSSAMVVYNIPIGIPNVFTPNGDDTNDFFKVVSAIPLTINEFKIWNRWGQLVYDNENGVEGWDGKQKKEEAASDVYIYRVTYEVTGGSGKKYTKKGDVSLLR